MAYREHASTFCSYPNVCAHIRNIAHLMNTPFREKPAEAVQIAHLSYTHPFPSTCLCVEEEGNVGFYSLVGFIIQKGCSIRNL